MGLRNRNALASVHNIVYTFFMDIHPVSLRRPAYPLLTALTAAAVLAACDDKPQQPAGDTPETEEEQLTGGFIVPARPWSPPAVGDDTVAIPAPETPETPACDAPDEVDALPADEEPLPEP